MSLHRRELLKTGLTASAAMALPRFAWAQPAFAPQPGAWRSFAVTTRIAIAQARGSAQAWIPLPAVNETGWFKSLGSEWTGNGTASVVREPNYGAQLLHVEWPNGSGSATVEVTSRIATRDRAVDLAKPKTTPPLAAGERALYTRGTELIPVDGIVKETSDRIVAGAAAELDKARDRVVANYKKNKGIAEPKAAPAATSGKKK